MSKIGVYHLIDGSKDKRYTVTKECTGRRPIDIYVIRFYDKWVGSARTVKEAWILAQEHYDNHKIDAVYSAMNKKRI